VSLATALIVNNLAANDAGSMPSAAQHKKYNKGNESMDCNEPTYDSITESGQNTVAPKQQP